MKINELGITQQELRNTSQLPEMIRFVKGGGVFSSDAIVNYHLKTEGSDGYVDLIEIARFEDGRFFLRNGHHRAVAIYLAGREVLLESEYKLSNWRYSDFLGINFERGWYTPFDVRNEVRLADLTVFKQQVKQLYREGGESAATGFIRGNKKLYSEEKRIEGVAALAATTEVKDGIQC